MKKLLSVTIVALMALSVVMTNPRPAEARGWGGGGFVAGAIIGGVALAAILASRHRHHRYYSYGYAPRYYSYGYSRPYYAGFGGWRHHHHRRHW